ncbi:MAG: hypothetical protein M3R55_14905 [Acidobacteriota bacterium]|nr:hypothetical protein [Acidobacteriota bacterium]
MTATNKHRRREGNVEAFSDFDGGSLELHSLEGSVLRGGVFRERVCHADGELYDYSRHFCFGLTNYGTAAVTVEVLLGTDSAESLPDDPPLLYSGPAPDEEFVPTRLAGRTDRSYAYAFDVPLAAGETRVIANYYFRDYDAMVRRFGEVGRRTDARVEVIGQSIEGRPLTMFSWTRPGPESNGRHVIVMTSAVHPPEPDMLATEAVMGHFDSDEGRRWLEQCDFHIIPIANPDGFVHGYSGCNAAQVNFYWVFRTDDPREAPEAFHLWEVLKRLKPTVYFDWHGYTFQTTGRHAAPYEKPVSLNHGSVVRALVARMNDRVAAAGGGHRTRGFLTHAPSTLAPKLTAAYNTITYAKYHLELRLGIARNRELALQVVRAAIETLRDAPPRRALLLQPHGDCPRDVRALVAWPLHNIWRAQIRKRLGIVWRAVVGKKNA